MNRNFKEGIREAGIRIKDALGEVRRYDWHYEREQLKSLPTNLKYTVGQQTQKLIDALPPRVAERVYDAYHFLRRPHYRRQGLAMIERGLANVAQDIGAHQPEGIPPVAVTIAKRLQGVPVTLTVDQSITRLRIYRGNDAFSVFERYGYGKADALRITTLPPKDTKKRILRQRPSSLKKVEFRNNLHGEPVVTRIRWYHTTSRKYIAAIEGHVKDIQESDAVKKKWHVEATTTRRDQSQADETLRGTGAITPSPSSASSSGKHTLMNAFAKK